MIFFVFCRVVTLPFIFYTKCILITFLHKVCRAVNFCMKLHFINFMQKFCYACSAAVAAGAGAGAGAGGAGGAAVCQHTI